ncbi:hypothetical protein ASC87_20025 [Rhizobacter sp. Root1221]|nr:hypothetical protein ASC87_20025 [Rhizobacter sp. Root1221]
MWVSVVQLRRDGKTLSKKEIAAAERREGVLTFGGYRLMGVPEVQYSATLRGSDSPGAMDSLKPLYGARLRSIKGPDMLIAGREVRRDSGKPSEEVPQAW